MLNYISPEVKIIAFTARESLATSEDVNNDEITLGQPDLSMEETVGPWD